MRAAVTAGAAAIARTAELVAAPRPARRGTLAAVALAALGVAAVAVALPLPPVAAAVTLAVFALAALGALAGAAAAHPHPRFGLANRLTLVRAGGAAVFAGLAVAPQPVAGAAAWTVAGAAAILLALDGVDGWVARRQRLASPFGARFDLETDALTILALSALALALGKAGPWVLALGLMRYAFVAAGWLWPSLARPLPPSLRRKTVCVVQIAVLGALIAPVLVPPVSSALAAAALLALAWSFALDLAWLLRAPR